VYKCVLILYEPGDRWSLWKLRPRSKYNIKMDIKDVRRVLYWI